MERISFAFISNRESGEEFQHDIFLINADGTGESNLTDTGFYTMDVHSAWSPDGERIAFMSSEPGAYTFEVYVINVDGTGVTNLTNNPSSSDHHPDW